MKFLHLLQEKKERELCATYKICFIFIFTFTKGPRTNNVTLENMSVVELMDTCVVLLWFEHLSHHIMWLIFYDYLQNILDSFFKKSNLMFFVCMDYMVILYHFFFHCRWLDCSTINPSLPFWMNVRVPLVLMWRDTSTAIVGKYVFLWLILHC